MRRWRSSPRDGVRLLVATTVVEVGVDVPEATVMVIEHAERFGLAQLHQLRGRVGRGREQSFCLLLHEDGLTDTMRRRLTLLRDTEDGFLIADEDFRLRGGGDRSASGRAACPATGSRTRSSTSGCWRSRATTRRCCWSATRRWRSERGQAMRVLMRLFERKEAVQTLAAG